MQRFLPVLIFIVSLLVLLGFVVNSTIIKVPAGYEGVRVVNFGKKSGVQDEALTTGRYVCLPVFCEVKLFPMFEQTVSYPNIGFQSVEGLSLGAPISVKFQVNVGQSPKLYKQYQKGIDDLKMVVFSALTNDAINRIASNYTVEEIYAGGKQKLIDEVTEYMNSKVETYGANVIQVMWAGLIMLPTEVKQGIDAKIQAKQLAEQRENEIRTQEAEAKKLVIAANAQKDAQKAETDAQVYQITKSAEAQAQANKMINQSLSEELIEYQKIINWDGRLPSVTGSAIPFIDADKYSGSATN